MSYRLSRGYRRFREKIDEIVYFTPRGRQKHLVERLRSELHGVPHAMLMGESEAGNAWTDFTNRLRELVLEDNPMRFLRWDVIRQTMFLASAGYIGEELRHLKNRKDWMAVWQKAVRESRLGDPIPLKDWPASSGNLIHHAYHLSLLNEKTGKMPGDFDYILEFGGGYGSQCRLFYKMGFSGRYVIYDLKQFSSLQRFYLESLNLPMTTQRNSLQGIQCISDLESLDSENSFISAAKSPLLIATWSLSESPEAIRLPFVRRLPLFRHVLIAYQDAFGEVDNLAYFSRVQREHPGFLWHAWPIAHLPKSNYLIGSKKSD